MSMINYEYSCELWHVVGVIWAFMHINMHISCQIERIVGWIIYVEYFVTSAGLLFVSNAFEYSFDLVVIVD